MTDKPSLKYGVDYIIKGRAADLDNPPTKEDILNAAADGHLVFPVKDKETYDKLNEYYHDASKIMIHLDVLRAYFREKKQLLENSGYFSKEEPVVPTNHYTLKLVAKTSSTEEENSWIDESWYFNMMEREFGDALLFNFENMHFEKPYAEKIVLMTNVVLNPGVDINTIVDKMKEKLDSVWTISLI